MAEQPHDAVTDPVAHLPAVRIEQALVTLAVHTQQIDGRLEAIESRIAACEAVAAELPGTLELPSHDDLLDVRLHSAKVAAEVSRLTINMYARIDDLAVKHREAIAELERQRDRARLVDLSDAGEARGEWAATA